MEMNFTGVFERDGEWWIGYTEELRGAFGQGRTLDECRESLREAIVLVLEAQRELRSRRDQLAGDTAIRETLAVSVP